MKIYSQNTEEVLREFSSPQDGLSAAEVEKRQEQYGKNKLQEAKKETLLHKFWRQICDPMVLVLLAAAVVSTVSTAISNSVNGTSESFADGLIILFVVILNSILGVVQESRAEQAIDALKSMTASTCKVWRDGKICVLKNEELVPGDRILIEAGDSIPADCRVLECAGLKVEEAALTGESVAIDKTSERIESTDGKEVPLGDRKNLCFLGSTAVYGRGNLLVYATGMNTEMGKIATSLADAKDEKTPLQKKLASLSRLLTKAVLGICALVFAVQILQAVVLKSALSFPMVLDSFMVAVSLAVAAIPEGLAAVVTIVLSIGVTRMSKRNAVIRKLTAVETLGCAQVICSDKTGTLTQNKMTVVEAFLPSQSPAALQELARAMALSSDAEWEEADGAVGEPTECALVAYAAKNGLKKPELKAAFPRVDELPFDSMRKLMTTLHKAENAFVQYTKGAPDEVLARCEYYAENGSVLPLTAEKRAEFSAQNQAMAAKALRVLAAAKRETPLSEAQPSPSEEGLVFLGLCGMIDPVRPEVKDAVARCKNAGIRVVMITGDHIDTAAAIARELGIIQSAEEAMRGADLDDLTDEELLQVIEKISVYARVQPEHKVRIVNAWKQSGKICAMTGDGVNDAPSIKAASIGIGMGITGTDVTKAAADMILADDNFATIVSAVEEGRKIYANIQKSIQFLLSSNLSEILSILIATLCGFVILKPVHLLWINLITDSLPALALGMEHAERDVMKHKPRDPAQGIFAGGIARDTVYQGILVAFLTLTSYAIGHHYGEGDGMTMAFLTMSLAEIFHAFNLRSRRESLFRIRKQNIVLWLSALLALILTTGVIFIPALASLFSFTVIGLKEYGVALGLAFSMIPIVEVIKSVQRALRKKRKKA